jgi:hypothetical protein
MDITTVLNMITLLDMKISKIEEDHNDTRLFLIANDHTASDLRQDTIIRKSVLKPLIEIRDHLQSFIEAELTKEENNTVE